VVAISDRIATGKFDKRYCTFHNLHAFYRVNKSGKTKCQPLAHAAKQEGNGASAFVAINYDFRWLPGYKEGGEMRNIFAAFMIVGIGCLSIPGQSVAESYCTGVFEEFGVETAENFACTSSEQRWSEGGCTGFQQLGSPIDDLGPCQAPVCGDGGVEPFEFCDDGIANGTPGLCNTSCTAITPDCGNEVIEPPEECDAGNLNGSGIASCSDACTLACDMNPNIIEPGASSTWAVVSNGINDTYSIQCALNAAAVVNDSTVILDGPSFIVKDSVGVSGFNGSLKGLGNTTVTAQGRGRPALKNSIFYFDGLAGAAGASLSDLDIHVPDGGEFQADHWGAIRDISGAALYFVENAGASVQRVSITTDNSNYDDIFNPNRHLDRGIIADSCYDSFDMDSLYMHQIIRSIYAISESQVPAERRCAYSLTNSNFVDLRNTFYFVGGILPSLYSPNTDFLVTGNRFENTSGAWLPLHDGSSTVSVSNNEFINTKGNAALWLEGATGNSEITGNGFRGGSYARAGLTLSGSENVIATGNVFENLGLTLFGDSQSMAVYIDGASNNMLTGNDYRRSGKKPWVKTVDGWFEELPLILVDNWTGPAFGNLIKETRLPAVKGVSLCQMIYDFTDNPQTPEYDGHNSIHHWTACEDHSAGRPQPNARGLWQKGPDH
jgi:hypothetical protein